MVQYKNQTGWILATWALVIAMGSGLALTFSVWTASSWLAFPRFLIALVFLFVIPGSQLIQWCRLQMSALEHVTLSVLLGMVVTSVLYVVLTWLDVASLLYLWVIAATAAFGRTWRTRVIDLRKKLFVADQTHFLLLLAVILSWLPMYMLPLYYRDLSLTGNGGLTVSQGDVSLHTSLAFELAHTFPPLNPFFAGQPLSYHVGMDLIAALLHRYGNVAIADLVVRFCPTLFITIDVLAVFCLARRFVGAGPAAVAAAVLVTLGEDFSFIPGILQHSEGLWSVQYFAAPTVFSLYFENPMVLGQGLLFTSLLCLQRSIKNPRWGWIIVTSLCSAALVETKIFLFIQLFLALWIVFVLELFLLKRFVLLRQCVAISLMGLPLILYTLIGNRTGAQIEWTWSNGLQNYVQPAFRQAQWPLLVTYPIAGLVLYLALTYGFRIIGVGELIKSFRLSAGRSFDLLLAIFVVLGPTLTLASKIVPRDQPGGYDNAIWFMIASKYLMTLFATLTLTKFWYRLDWTGRSLMAVLVAVASLGSTVQYLDKMWGYALTELTAPTMQAVDFLNGASHPGQVAVSHLDEAILDLTALRVPISIFAPELALASMETYTTRKQDVGDFWQSWQAGTVREDFLTKYNVDWIVVSRHDTPPVLGTPPVIILEKLKIERRFTNSEFIVYEVRLAREAS